MIVLLFVCFGLLFVAGLYFSNEFIDSLIGKRFWYSLFVAACLGVMAYAGTFTMQKIVSDVAIEYYHRGAKDAFERCIEIANEVKNEK